MFLLYFSIKNEIVFLCMYNIRLLFVCVVMFVSCSKTNSVLDIEYKTTMNCIEYSNGITFCLEKANIKTNKTGSKMCSNYFQLEHTDSVIYLRSATLQQLLSFIYQVPEININLMDTIKQNYSDSFFNVSIISQEKNLSNIHRLDLYKCVQDFFGLNVRIIQSKNSARTLIVEDMQKLLNYKSDVKQDIGVDVTDKIIIFNNCTLKIIANFLQNYLSSKIIYQGNDNNNYTFTLPNDIDNVYDNLRKMGIDEKFIFVTDTVYEFY